VHETTAWFALFLFLSSLSSLSRSLSLFPNLISSGFEYDEVHSARGSRERVRYIYVSGYKVGINRRVKIAARDASADAQSRAVKARAARLTRQPRYSQDQIRGTLAASRKEGGKERGKEKRGRKKSENGLSSPREQ